MDIQKLLYQYGDNVFSLAVIATKSTQAATEIFFKTFEKAFAEGIAEENALYKACAALCMETDINEEASTITDFKMKKAELEFCEKLLVEQQKIRIIMHLYYNSELEMSVIADIIGMSEKNAQRLFDEASEELQELAEEHYLTAMINVTVPDGTMAYALKKLVSGDGRLFELKNDAVPRHSWTKKQKTAVTIAGIIVTAIICIVVPIVQMLINQSRDLEGVDLNQSEPSVIFTAAGETTEEAID